MNLAFRMASAADDLPKLPGSLHVNRRLSTWLTVLPEGVIEVRPGKVEIGQGIVTALAQIVAEELDVSLARIRMVPARTDASPDEAVTSGSLSLQESGAALRHAAAEVRSIYVACAAALLGADASSLRVDDGEILAPDGGRTSYWSLADPALLACEATPDVRPKPPAAHAVVGRSVPRFDLPDKVLGRPRYVHDLQLPGMLHGRVLRPPSPAAELAELDAAAILRASAAADGDDGSAAMRTGEAAGSPGAAAGATSDLVGVVRNGRFVGVVARTERGARASVERIRSHARWTERASLPDLPDAASLAAWLASQPVETTVIDRRGAADREGVDRGAADREGVDRDAAGRDAAGRDTAGPDAADRDGADRDAAHRDAAHRPPTTRTLRATYTRPFIAHASIGPACAIARWSGDSLHVWSHTQGVFNLRADLAIAFGIPATQVVVEHVEGAGCYGHNGADDVALDAALLARAHPGRPVRVLWSRADELGWAPFGPAMRIDLEASLDAGGEVVDWRHTVWSNGHGIRPGRAKTPTLLAAAHVDPPFPAPVAINARLASGGGAERNAVPLYDFPSRQVTSHRLLSMPVRSSALRSLGAFANVFAIESFVDELAALGGEDPLEWRLRHLADERARCVLERAAARAGWPLRGRAPGSAGGQDAAQPLAEGRGRGIAVARYKGTGGWCAVVADVEVDTRLRVRRLVIAVDVGQVINPDGLANQVEGGAIQATSWTLLESVRFDGTRITSTAWPDYPILRFSDVPAVEVEIVARPDEPALGAGEISVGPTAAAIGNALADALGVRVRDLPMSPERIVAAARA